MYILGLTRGDCQGRRERCVNWWTTAVSSASCECSHTLCYQESTSGGQKVEDTTDSKGPFLWGFPNCPLGPLPNLEEKGKLMLWFEGEICYMRKHCSTWYQVHCYYLQIIKIPKWNWIFEFHSALLLRLKFTIPARKGKEKGDGPCAFPA